MQLEHCQKCHKQIEFVNKKNKRHASEKDDINQLQTKAKGTAIVYTQVYCTKCFYDLEDLMQEKGFLPRGINSGFKGDND